MSSIDEKIYQAYLDSHTSIKGITPEEVHNTGMDQIEKYKKEMMMVVRDELKMPNITFKEFFEQLRKDKKHDFDSVEAVMEYYTKIIRYSLQFVKLHLT